jgi:CBS domain-containing protein
VDVAEFLRRYAPFSELAEERLRKVARSVEIAHVPAGKTILRQGGEPVDGLHVIRKGAVELVDEGRVIDLLGEGEVFGQSSLLAHGSPSLTVRAHEDTLVYVVPEPLATEVLESGAGLAFVAASFRRRLRAATDGARTDPGDARYRAVGSLVRRAPVRADPSTTIADAARLMTDERVSCLLLPLPDGLAIVTDRDLRAKVVAGGVAADRPVLDVATQPVRTIDAGALAGDALTEMIAAGVHHLPVLEHGTLVGVVTDTDLMGLGRHTPFSLKSAIARASTRDDVADAARDLPEVVAALVESHADPVDVGRVIALAIDAVTERLVELAIVELGSPPAPFAWLALGSGARHEQALATDQDHALAYGGDADDPAALDAAFAALAGFVTDGLEAAGVPRCRGDAMAVHPTMRRSLEGWAVRFRGWMDEPDVDSSILSSIGFDFRRQAGALDAEPVLDAAVAAARAHPAFLKMLGRRALALKPPTGFIRDLVVEGHGEHAGRLDVKHGGITIVTNLARVYAVQAGVAAKPTIARLQAATAAGVLDPHVAGELAEAFRFLWGVRLRHQADQVAAGVAPDDFVDPGALGPLARSGLKEAFRAIARAQRQLASEQGVEAR